MTPERPPLVDPLECPGIDCWQALFTDFPAEQREAYERHLESCPVCQERLDRAEECGDDLRRLVRRVGNPTTATADPTLIQFLQRLHETKGLEQTCTEEPADLYFLQPGERPGVLGVLDGYDVLEVIGQGGMGVVLKAFDPALHRLVAIKVMAAAVAGSAVARRRFTREAQAAAAVCHDHIVAVHGVHEADGLPYLVMQYVPGESLQDRLDRLGPLETVEVVRIGMQTASGLAAAHAQGLIHRDIKPANLLLENGLARVKITDFGLARMVDDVGLTQNGVVAGTPEYMAPEQARSEPVDHRADLFSLGSVLYAMCTGRPPFRASTTLAVLRQVSEQEPPPIRSLNPDVPAWLETLVVRLMAKDPAQRVPSAAEAAALLEGYLAHLRQPASSAAPALPSIPLREGGQKMQPRWTPRKWFLAAALLGMLVLLGAIAAGVLAFRETGAPAANLLDRNAIPSLEPKAGLVCLLVNKHSGRCLTIAGQSDLPGMPVVQGPTSDQAGAAERWALLETGKVFRLRNEKTGLFLEINNAFTSKGTRAVQGPDQPTKTNQLWTFEPVQEGYLLRPGHCQLVLAIGASSHEEGARAIQWQQFPGLDDQVWELRPAPGPSRMAADPQQPPAKQALHAAAPAQPFVKEFYHDFRGSRPLPPELMLDGGDAEEMTRPEDGGLRITIPATRRNRDPVGARAAFAVAGDFEITGTYEILSADRPAKDNGVGVALNIATDPAVRNFAKVGRFLRVKEGNVFIVESWNKDRPGSYWIEGTPTETRTGQLRLMRQGSTLRFLATEGPGTDFRELYRDEFGTNDLTLARFVVNNSGSPAGVDARLVDLKIRCGQTAASTIPVQSTTWWGTIEILVLVLVLALVLAAVGGWLLLHRRRRVKKTPAPVAADKPAQADAAEILGVHCIGCGKNLKTRTTLAGKKIKCPQCGQAVRVPSIKTGGTATDAM